MPPAASAAASCDWGGAGAGGSGAAAARHAQLSQQSQQSQRSQQSQLPPPPPVVDRWWDLPEFGGGSVEELLQAQPSGGGAPADDAADPVGFTNDYFAKAAASAQRWAQEQPEQQLPPGWAAPPESYMRQLEDEALAAADELEKLSASFSFNFGGFGGVGGGGAG